MVKKANVELVGIEDVEMILNQLPKTFQKSVLNKALKESSKPLFEVAKVNLDAASRGFGGGMLSHLIRQVTRTQMGLPGQEIGAYPTKRARRSEAVWEDMGAYWLEWGTMEYMTKPREPRTRPLHVAQQRVGGPGSRRGRIPAMGWLRKSLDMTERQIDLTFRNELWKVLNKKLLAKAKRIKWSGLQTAGISARGYAKAKGR